MRGGFTHNRVLADRLAQAFECAGAVVLREHPVRAGRNPRCVDLWVEWNRCFIAGEIEIEPRRAGGDLDKARQLGAHILLLVTPTGRVARAVEQFLKRSGHGIDELRPRIFVMPLGAALQAVANKSLLRSVSIVTQTLILESVNHADSGQTTNPNHNQRFS